MIHNTMMPVILESPYAGDTKTHEIYARAAMRDSLDRGEAPLASHVLFAMTRVLDDRVPVEREWGIAAGFAWLPLAHKMVVYTDLGISNGMEAAMNIAHSEGLRVETRELFRAGGSHEAT